MAELVPVPVAESLLSGEEFVLVSPDDELAGTDGLESGCGVGLTEGDVDAAGFFLAFLVVLGAGVWLAAQLVLVAWLAAVLVPLELAGEEVAEAGAVAVPLLLALALALPLALALALVLTPVLAAELLLPVAGLVVEPGELGGAVGELGAVLEVLADGVGEGDADDGEHDEAADGCGCRESVVLAPTPPP